MKVLFYHAGADCLAQAFKDNGHDVIDIMLNDEFENIPFYSLDDGWNIEELKKAYGQIDIILANPNCKTYSKLGIRAHRIISDYSPKTQLAADCDQWNEDFVYLINELKPKYYFIENPSAALKKMDFMEGIPVYTVTYSSYGGEVYKPTDIFTNHPFPNFKTKMSMGEQKKLKDAGILKNICELANAKERSVMPDELVEHIYNISLMSDDEIEKLIGESRIEESRVKEKTKRKEKSKMPKYNKTQLTPQKEFERHIYHRDQFAHYLRWTHVLKNAKTGMKILDFGCGSGEMLELFYRNRYRPAQYLGLDIRQSQVDENNAKFGSLDFAEFRAMDLCHEFDLGQTFDIITCFEVIEHIGHANADAFLNNIAFHCDENTTVYLSTPNYDPRVGAAQNHMLKRDDGTEEVGEWDHEELKAKLSEYFTIEHCYGTFASIKDYKAEIANDWRKKAFDELSKYYDTNMLAVIMAPMVAPENARNCIWVLKAKEE